MREPSLDDAFLALTGRKADSGDDDDERGNGKRRGGGSRRGAAGAGATDRRASGRGAGDAGQSAGEGDQVAGEGGHGAADARDDATGDEAPSSSQASGSHSERRVA